MISCFNISPDDRDVIQQSSYKMNRWKGRKSREDENIEPAAEFAKPSLKKINIVNVRNRDNRKLTNFEAKTNRPRNMPISPSPTLSLKLDNEEEDGLDLPDGSCFNRSMLLRFSTKLSTKECQVI